MNSGKTRTLAQLENHFLVERELATRLRNSDRSQRTKLYETLYQELFQKVPDHPRLSRRVSEAQTSRSNQSKFAILRPFLKPGMTVLDFGAGDCQFAAFLTQRASKVIALEIADQRPPNFSMPNNLSLILYDGYEVSGINNAAVDLAFSDQLIEHFHPDDTPLHLKLVHRFLKQGGHYVIRTPSAITGPHDISRYFSSVPEGFHLKEWTYTEFSKVAREAGFRKCKCYWALKRLMVRMPLPYFKLVEALFHPVAGTYTYPVAYLAVPTLCCALQK